MTTQTGISKGQYLFLASSIAQAYIRTFPEMAARPKEIITKALELTDLLLKEAGQKSFTEKKQ